MDKVVTGDNIIYLNKRGSTSITSATLRKGVMTDDTASYKIESTQPLEIKINSTIDIFGKSYRVNNSPQWVKNAENSYSYDVLFEGVMYDLQKVMYFNADGTGFKTDSDFSLIGTIEVFLLCLKNNLKRLSLDWEIGTYQVGETKTLAFSQDNCLTALQKICQEFKVEFRIDDANNKNIINVGIFGNDLNYTFEYGKGKGLYSLASTNVDENSIVNRMYVAGGTDNLPNNYNNYSTHLKMPNGVEFLEDAHSISQLGLKEGFIDFPDIFPSRKGVVSAIDANKNVFFDTSMDFDLNAKEADGVTTKYLKPDVTVKVHFNTGNLAGYEFELKKNGGYDHVNKKFEVITITNDTDQKFPNPDAAAFQFQIGDEYVILDIYYPEIYITNAENKLKEKAEEQFPINLQPKVNYKLNVDEKYLEKIVVLPEEVPFDLGDKVTVIDNDFAVNKKIKIVGFTRDILNPYNYNIDLADSYAINFSSQIALSIVGIQTNITTQAQINAQNQAAGYRRLNELKDLTFDTDGYFVDGKIRPESIETILLTVGAKSQQFALIGVSITPNYLANPNEINLSTGDLTHYSIEDLPRTWNFTTALITGLVSTTPYYVYAKCGKSGVQAEWIVSAEKIVYNSIANYYYFLVGVLHKEKNGVRAYSPLDGFSLFNGRYITTGRIQAVNEKTWFDLDLGAFLLANQAGMTGNGNVNEYFLWAGADYADRNNAPFGVTKEGLLQFKNTAGIKVFELGLKSGKVAFNIFNETTGVLQLSFTDQGIVFIGYIAESYTEITARSIDEVTYPTNLDKVNHIKGAWLKTQLPSGDYKVFLPSTSVVGYQYNAGNNLYTANNLQYEGKVFATENTLGSLIPGGYYALYQESIFPAGTTGNISFGTTIYNISFGNIIESIPVSVVKDFASIIEI